MRDLTYLRDCLIEGHRMPPELEVQHLESRNAGYSRQIGTIKALCGRSFPTESFIYARSRPWRRCERCDYEAGVRPPLPGETTAIHRTLQGRTPQQQLWRCLFALLMSPSDAFVLLAAPTAYDINKDLWRPLLAAAEPFHHKFPCHYHCCHERNAREAYLLGRRVFKQGWDMEDAAGWMSRAMTFDLSIVNNAPGYDPYHGHVARRCLSDITITSQHLLYVSTLDGQRRSHRVQ